MRVVREGVERLDVGLVSLARGEAALRLQLGQALEVLGRGGVFRLGFSSVGAYAVERCERSVRWAEGARCLARRVEVLPRLREAIAVGRVSWSMAEVLARLATPADEERWLEAAESRTVRQMRLLLTRDRVGGSEAAASACARSAVAAAGGSEAAAHLCARSAVARAVGGWGDEVGEASRALEMTTVTCTVPREDAWFFEATRHLLQHLGARTADEQSEALLAEARGLLLSLLPEDTVLESDCRERDEVRRRWLLELARWREQAEALCEKNVLGVLLSGRGAGPSDDVERSSSVTAAGRGLEALAQAPCEAIDARVRALSGALARRELELSVLLLAFHRADGWRRLGYASEAQYARERLGSSPSSLLARRALASKLEKLPAVAAALGAGQIGVEAALQVVRIATASTEARWVARARSRTIKHLREEVAAALTAVRWSGEVDCPPPVDAEIEAFHRLEQAVVNGRIGPGHIGPGGIAPGGVGPGGIAPGRIGLTNASGAGGGANDGAIAVGTRPPSEVALAERRAWFVMLGSLASWLGSALQTSAVNDGGTVCPGAMSKAGQVTLRLRMSRENAASWRELHSQVRRWLPRGMSWLRFVCLSLWHAWQHLLGTSVAYGHIYVRDRFRCMSPVCPRRDVTPHHLRFRSAGGGDEDENMGSVCTWCHLQGVHGGRIRARGPASCIHWELGPRGSPCVVVHGRERVALEEVALEEAA